MNKMIPLTKYFDVNHAEHILYFFEEKKYYLDNLIAFIKTGIVRGHHLLIIENTATLLEIENRVHELFSKEEQKYVHYFDNYSFYQIHGEFHIQTILEHSSEILTPFFNQNITVRTWAHVEWSEQDDIARKLLEHEHLSDRSVNDMGIMSVCAYAASDLSASLQTAMMRCHEYLMTDQEIVRSCLYKKS